MKKIVSVFPPFGAASQSGNVHNFRCFPWIDHGFMVCRHCFSQTVYRSIVIRRNWLGNPAIFKGTNKDKKIYVGRSTTLHNLLFCAHTLWLNYVTVTFLLVTSLGTNYGLLWLCRVMAKKANKNIEQRILPSFLTIYLY